MPGISIINARMSKIHTGFSQAQLIKSVESGLDLWEKTNKL